MKPIEFEGHNTVFAKNQPEYLPLPARVDNDEYGTVTTVWELSHDEIKEICASRRLILQQMTFGRSLQPVKLMVDIADNDRALTPEVMSEYGFMVSDMGDFWEHEKKGFRVIQLKNPITGRDNHPTFLLHLGTKTRQIAIPTENKLKHLFCELMQEELTIQKI